MKVFVFSELNKQMIANVLKGLNINNRRCNRWLLNAHVLNPERG